MSVDAGADVDRSSVDQAEDEVSSEVEAETEHVLDTEDPDPRRLMNDSAGSLILALRRMGCAANELRAIGRRWFAACGRSGLWVLEPTSLPAGSYAASDVIVTEAGNYRIVHRERFAFAVMGIDESLVAQLQYSQVVARGTKKTSEPQAPARTSLIAPDTPAYSLALAGRTTIGIDGREGGILSGGGLSIAARFRRFRAMAEAGPFVYSKAASTMSGTIALGYTTKRYGFDIVGGAAYINYDPPFSPGAAAVWGLGVRVGHEDGLHFRARGRLGWHVSHVVLADVNLGVQLPVNQRFVLMVDGYHGRIGRSGIELGIRGRVSGTGGARSLFVLGGVGALMTFTSNLGVSTATYPDAWALGPILSLGVLYRL